MVATGVTSSLESESPWSSSSSPRFRFAAPPRPARPFPRGRPPALPRARPRTVGPGVDCPPSTPGMEESPSTVPFASEAFFGGLPRGRALGVSLCSLADRAAVAEGGPGTRTSSILCVACSPVALGAGPPVAWDCAGSGCAVERPSVAGDSFAGLSRSTDASRWTSGPLCSESVGGTSESTELEGGAPGLSEVDSSLFCSVAAVPPAGGRSGIEVSMMGRCHQSGVVDEFSKEMRLERESRGRRSTIS
jgi:hypothetical protein